MNRIVFRRKPESRPTGYAPDTGFRRYDATLWRESQKLGLNKVCRFHVPGVRPDMKIILFPAPVHGLGVIGAIMADDALTQRRNCCGNVDSTGSRPFLRQCVLCLDVQAAKSSKGATNRTPVRKRLSGGEGL